MNKWQAVLGLSLNIAKSWIRKQNTAPYKLQLFTTQKCDCRCKICGCWQRTVDGETEVSNDILLNAAESISENLLWVGISGGEPTSRADFPKLVIGLGERCKKLRILNFSTNAINQEYLVSRIEKSLEADIPIIIASISIDGLADLHDDLRGLQGAFKSMIKNADKLINLEKKHPNFFVAFETTISPLNKNKLTEIQDFVQSRYKNHMHVFTIAGSGYLVGRNASHSMIAGKDEIAAIKKAIKHTTANNLFGLIPNAYLGIVDKYLADHSSPIKCVAGRDMITVDSFGDVRICDFLEESLGNLSSTNGNLAELLENKEVQQKISKYENCRQCFEPCQAYPSLLASPKYLISGIFNNLKKKMF